jgi:ribose transport system ATP-binding protein
MSDEAVTAGSQGEHAARPVVEISSLSKSYGGTVALASFDLAIVPGEVHVLVGANGSGKSTLIKVLSGFHSPDEGNVLIGGHPLPFGHGGHSYRLGCRFVHQDLGLVGSLSVQDNLYLGNFPTRLATICSSRMKAAARDMLEHVGLDLDPAVCVEELGAAQRTGVALARAMRTDAGHPARLLVLDEPTATMPSDEVNYLLALIRAAASRGVAVLFVTHHLDEVFRIADAVTVLRDGRVVGRGPIAAVQRPALVKMLAGNEVEPVSGDVATSLVNAGAAALDVTGLWAGPLRGISLSVAPGEVIGLAGLTGSGRETALSAIFGAEVRDKGSVRIGGRLIPARRPDLAMAAGAGLLPGDRKALGGIMSLSARENLSLSSLKPFWARGRLSRSRESAEALSWFAELNVRPAKAIDMELTRFSGGNQQKVLFAKWMRRRPAVLLLEDPTQGVDVSAKVDLHRHLIKAAQDGMAIVVSSTDIDELVTLCSRVLVLRNGRISKQLTGARVVASEITKSIMSEVPAGQA